MAIAWLAAHPNLDVLIYDADADSNRVYGDAPKGAVVPFITVERVGGRPDAKPHWIDKAHLQILAWGEADERSAAEEVCAVAVAALHELPGVRALGVVTAVEDVLGPRPLPDPETSRPRYLAEVLLTTHPLRESGS